MRTTATALCFSVAEYCCPVWAHSTHRKLVNTTLNETCCLITGCIRPTATPDLYMLSGIAPSEIRRSVHRQNERERPAYTRTTVSSQPPSLSCVSPQKLVLRSGRNSGRLVATQSNLTKYDVHPKEQLPSRHTHCRGVHCGRPTECARDRLPPRQRNICAATGRAKHVCVRRGHL